MDRNDYLKLCQRRATGDKSVTVRCSSGEYLPHGYWLTFGKDGKAKHTAVLMDKGERSLLYIELGKVEEA